MTIPELVLVVFFCFTTLAAPFAVKLVFGWLDRRQ